MPDPTTLSPDIRTGFDSNAIFDMKLDTLKTMNNVLNVPDRPWLPPTSSRGSSTPSIDIPIGMTYEDALQSGDPIIRDLGVKHLEQRTQSDPYFSLGLANEIRTPEEQASKYIDKKFGFDANIPDIEDYYYRNDYMKEGFLKRNLVLNPLRFLGRVVVPGILKLGEGFGYVGSMVTSVGSSNYWADVADNAFSKWLENKEQSFKDHVLPIYHEAGFDEKGFFSQMTNYAFWNESVADGVAFMASAAIPGMTLGKLGTVAGLTEEAIAAGAEATNWFGRAFSTTSKLGGLASNIGLGSPAEVLNWTFNTAMEAAMEGSQTFHDNLKKMKQLRLRGIGEYADMSDEEMRTRAGHLAANTVGGNFMVLGLSNAWENTLFFAPFKTHAPSLSLGKDFLVEGSKKGLGRLPFYGKKAAQGFLAEGLWEENAQLAIQRMNSLDDNGDIIAKDGFFKQLGSQTVDAFTGNDPEASQNIGLGALIGIAGGGAFAKIAGERKELLNKIDRATDESRIMRNSLFSVNDIYEKDKEDNIVFKDGQPVVSPEKLKAKKEMLETQFGKLQLSTLEEYQNNSAVDMVTKQALGSYIASMYEMGVKDISKRFSELTPSQAAIFGIDNAKVREKAGEYGNFAKNAEREVIRTSKEVLVNPGLNPSEFATKSKAVKSTVYSTRIDNLILGTFITDEESKILSNLNTSRSLSNASLSAFPVEQINSLLYQEWQTKRLIASPDFTEHLPEVVQQFHLKREKDLAQQIEEFKKENASFLEESRVDKDGFYIAQHKTADGKLMDSPLEPVVITSNQKRANYTNTILQNSWIESNLLSKDWYNFYQKVKEIPVIKKIKEQLKQEQAAFDKSVFSKYKEIEQGDFKRVLRLVGSLIDGKTDFSPEELQLQQNYTKLIEELIPIYNNSLTNQTKALFTRKANTAISDRETLLSNIFEKKYKIGELSLSASTLVETMQNRLKENKVGLEELQTLIYATQKQISDLEESVADDEKKIDDYDRRLGILQEEAQAGDFQGIMNSIEELQKEREWVAKEIEEKKSLLDKLIQAIKEISNIAYKLFADIKGNYFKSKKQFDENLAKGRFEAVESFNEISLRTLDKNALEKELKNLEDTFTAIGKKAEYYKGVIDDINKAALAGFDEQLKLLTRQSQVVQSSTEEQLLTDSFSINIPPVLSNLSESHTEDWDGDDYIRPLFTKFITSTFSDRRVKGDDGKIIGTDYNTLSQEEKDHFHLMDYLTSGKNTADIKKKLGKAKLKVIAVTKHNIDQLGLKGLLYTKDKENDQAQYWEDTNPATARIDFIHVIEEKGVLYFIDKELNKLGEVGKIEEKDKAKIARTILRSAKFSKAEESQYDNKYSEKDKEKAVAYGLDQRKKLVEASKAFTLDNPTGVFGFDITRGIPVRAERADGKSAKNPVGKVLLKESEINGGTIVVTSQGNYTLNDSNITLPVGHAFIKTGGIFERLHYADNNILDENTADTVLAVMEKLSQSYVKKLEEVMVKKLDGKTLAELTIKEREKLVLEFNKTFKGGSFNKSYLAYLNSTTHFGLLKKGEKPHPNKIYIKGTSIHFGSVASIDMIDGGFTTNQDAKSFLTSLHHNVRYFPETSNGVKLSNSEFNEYYLENGELKNRVWKTLNHYLLSEKFPDGKVRDYIPVTTQIHTVEQAAQEKNTAPGNYTSQSIILGVSYMENKSAKKKSTFKEDDETGGVNEDGTMEFDSQEDLTEFLKKKPKKAPSKEKTENKPPKATGDLLAMVRAAGKQKKKEIEEEEKAISDNSDQKKGEPNNPYLRKLYREKQEREAKEGTVTKETTPEKTDDDITSDDNLWGTQDSAFRVRKEGFFNTESDLDSVIDYASNVIPQFPVERLKYAIQVTPDLQAFGEFTGNAIRLWEGAEEGTLYHEIFEAVANKLLKDYEWNALVKEFRNRKGSFVERETGKTITYSGVTDQQAKEELAEEFRTFKMTGKLYSGAKNTRTFFQMILDFIKNIFTHQVTIEGIFKDIDAGKLASRSQRQVNRFTSNYRKDLPIPYRKYKEFLNGFTALMFQDIFESPESVVGLDELGETDNVIYDRIREKIDNEYIAILEEFENGAFPTDTPNKELNEVNKKREKAINDIVANWDKIKDKWGDFVRNHKFEVRKFNLKFDEEYQLASEEDNKANRNDYTGSDFEISTKNSASASVRFVMGTIIKTKVFKGKDGKFTLGTNPILPNLGKEYSNSRLPQLENYDKMMAMISSKFAGLNDISLIEKKMKDISGLTRLQDAPLDEQQDIAQSFTPNEAAMTILYTRLFSPKKTISEEAMWNLRTKFLAYTSKQAPTPYILMMNDSTGSAFIQSPERGAYEKFHKRMTAAMTRNINNFFKSKIENGIKTYYPKESKYEIGANYFIAAGKSPEKVLFGNFLKFLGLYNEKNKEYSVITPEFLNALKDEDLETYRALVSTLHKIAKKLETTEPFSGAVSVKSLNIFGYTNDLLAILEKIQMGQSEKLMTYLDGANNARQNYISPSFASRILSEMSNAETLADLIESYPHFKQHVYELENGKYYTDSIILNRMFNEDGTRKGKMLTNLAYVDGIKSFSDNTNDDKSFKKTSRLEYHQRLGLQFNMAMSGMYNILTADSETEWALEMGELVNFERYIETDADGKNRIGEVIAEFYLPKLANEIDLALNFNGNSHQMNQKHKETGYKVGESLRFFKDILQFTDKGKTSKDLINKIHSAIQEGTSASVIITQNRKAIINSIKSYIQYSSLDLFNNLLENRVISETMGSNDALVYTINNLTTGLTEKFGDTHTLSSIRDVVTYATINSQLANFEQFKLIFGDVAQYKDWDKRAKSLLGPVEQAYFDKTGIFNKWLSDNKNNVEFEDEVVKVPKNDLFYTTFGNTLTARTIDDISTKNPELLNMLSEIGAKFSAYEETNEVDGQSIGNIHAFRHLLMKTGWRWTKKFEEFYQYDSALARAELAKRGIYTYSSDELQNIDVKILEKYKDEPPVKGPSPIKTLIPSVREDGTMDLLKHSIYPNSWQLAKGHPELEKLYIDMLKRGDDILNFKSAHKIGMPIDDKNRITPHYKIEDNGSQNPFETTNLIAEGNVQYELSFRTLGIQVETQGGGKQRIGSQLQKDITLNLMPNGVPADFRLSSGLESEEELIHAWNALTEEEKMDSKDYRLVRNTITTLENLKDKSVMDTFDKIGIGYTYKDGQFEYSSLDLVKLQQYIMDEMTRLEIDENTLDGMQLTEDKEAFLHASESLPSYNTVSNVIWAMSDKAISALKVNGVPYIQVSSAFFNTGQREATYFDGEKWIRVDNKEDFDRLQKEGKKMMLTSSDLKFYRKDVDGREVLGMEIKLPHIYKTKVNKMRKAKGLPLLSDRDLMDWLNQPENSKLLEGVGFRIPTQATSSIEFFTIKEFLPESFGKSIVVPSDITAKAGSDFDVDKLQTYLNNWKLNREGLPIYSKLDTEKDATQRFIDYIDEHVERNDRDIFKDMRESKEFFDKEKKIDAMYNKIAPESEELDYAKEDVTNEYNAGLSTFKKLPLSIKQQYWSKEDELRANDDNFVTKLARYYMFTNDFIKIFEEGKPIRLSVIRKNKEGKLVNEEEIITPQEVLPLFKDMLLNYQAVVQLVGLKDEAFARLREAIDKARATKKEEDKAFKLEMSNVIAEGLKLPNFEAFKQFPIHLQNTRGAVENEYFESIREILKQPERLIQLLSPNDMSNIKENRDTVKKAMDPNYAPEDKKELNYSNYLDMNYLSDKRNSFVRGKYDIAIFAVNMTNYANSQVTGLGITEGQVRPEDETIMKMVGYDISLPFNEAPLLTINGWGFIPLGNEKSADGRYIMDKISGYINGAVDVAKDPVIIEMGMHSDIAGIYMILERAGIKGKNIALFLMQPSIRDYMREVIFWKNPEFATTVFEWKKEIREAVLSKYGFDLDVSKYEKVTFDEDELTAMIRKGEIIRKEKKEAAENLRNGKPVKKVTEWSDSEKRMQALALLNFFKMEVFSNNMNDIRTSSNHDTSAIRSIHSLIRKDLIRDRTYEGNLIMAPTKTGFVNGADAMRQETYIQKTINLLNTFNSIFKNTNLFALQNSNPRSTLDKVATRIYKRNPYMSEDDFNSIMKEYDAAIVDSLLNNFAKVGNVHISSLKNQFFMKPEEHAGGVRHANNLFTMFEKIKGDDKYKRLLVDNFLLSNLAIEFDDKLGVYTIELGQTFEKGDPTSRNEIINGWRDILNSTDPQLSQFGKALLYGTIIQYGVKGQRGTLTPLIPLEYYSQISSPVMENIQKADFSNFDEEVVRENAYKKNFVFQAEPRAMDYVSSDGKIVTVWGNLTDTQRKLKKRPNLKQRLFVRNMSTGELRNYITEAVINQRFMDTYHTEPNGKVPNEVFRNLFNDEIKNINMRMVSRPVFMWQKYLTEEDEDENILSAAHEYITVRMPRPEFVTRMEVENRDGSFSVQSVLSKKVKEMEDRKDYSWSFIQVYKLVGLDEGKSAVVRKKLSTKGASKGKVSISLLYKPINSSGTYGFNEVANLSVDDDGNVIGSQSILNPNIPILEQTDDEITNMLRTSPFSVGLALNFINRNVMNAMTEQEAPITPEQRTANLNITVGKVTPKQYTWARTSPNSYEVSNAGDKRFSAFNAKLQKGTVLDLPNRPQYVLDRDASIEELYQVGVKGYKTINQGKGKIPLTGITPLQTWEHYKVLWQEFADQNPQLMDELAEKAKGKVLTDKYAATEISQARALSDILNDRTPELDDSAPEITPTC